MKIQMLDITCPKCRHKPTFKTQKLDKSEFFYFECGCTKSAAWIDIYDALSSWIIAVGKNGAFDWILKVHTEN